MMRTATGSVDRQQALSGSDAEAVTDTAVRPAAKSSLRLWRGKDGMLWGRTGDPGDEPRSVRVSRLFPWSHASEYVSLRDADDEELALVRSPADLEPDSRRALDESLAEAGFVMEIEAILSVEEEVEIRTFEVRTAQGTRSFQTERDAWPEALQGGGLLIRDVAGDLYAVRDPQGLDAKSRRLLWVFVD